VNTTPFSGLFLSLVPLVLVAYYLVIFLASKRPPKPGAVMVRYEPPAGLSAAGARYVWKGLIDERTIACVFAELIVKGRITVQRERGGFKITKLNPPAASTALTAEEQRTMEWLFSNFLDSTRFDPGRSSQGCIMSLRGLFDGNFCKQYESTRYGYIGIGIAVSLIATLMLARMSGRNPAEALKLALILYGTSVLAALVIGAVLVRAVADLVRGIGSIRKVVFGIVWSALPLAGVIGLAAQIEKTAPIQLAICVCALGAVNVAATPFLRSATARGIEVKQQIEGFREYLLKVEQDRLDRMMKAKTQPGSNDSLLGYAIALEVKEAWGDDLANAC